jgi:anti-sigma regulatory factor (Ser/Thr protein kinase)
LIVRNQRSELSRVSVWVEAWARQQRLPSTLAQILDLCAAEVLTNVISYAYDDNALHPISLNLRVDEDRISLEIEDEGKPFDPGQLAAQPLSTLDEGRIGGWGLRIVRHFADDLQYRRVGERNRVTVVFRQPNPAPN